MQRVASAVTGLVYHTTMGLDLHGSLSMMLRCSCVVTCAVFVALQQERGLGCDCVLRMAASSGLDLFDASGDGDVEHGARHHHGCVR